MTLTPEQVEAKIRSQHKGNIHTWVKKLNEEILKHYDCSAEKATFIAQYTIPKPMQGLLIEHFEKYHWKVELRQQNTEDLPITICTFKKIPVLNITNIR